MKNNGKKWKKMEKNGKKWKKMEKNVVGTPGTSLGNDIVNITTTDRHNNIQYRH